MNLQHLRYVIEIEKTESISKAAENLFMAQPNLSKGLKELEEAIGITIFKRTTKGVTLTEKGAEFMPFAKNIISQIDAIEKLYNNDKCNSLSLSISVPRASYISDAFVQFIKTLDTSEMISLNYKETNAMRAINNLTDNNYNLGIIRYQQQYDKYFKILFKERKLNSKEICSFKYTLLMSSKHMLANSNTISLDDLSSYIEVVYGDPYVPMLPTQDIMKSENCEKINKHIYIYERSSQFNILSEIPKTFMRTSPIPKKYLEIYDLVEKNFEGFGQLYKDVLIFHDNHVFNNTENNLLQIIKETAQTLSMQ